MPERLRITNWERLVEELERFDAPEQTVETDRVRLSFGRAHLSVTRDGQFDAGMPLHEVSGETADSLVIDHTAGTVTLTGDSFEYTFRRPE